MMTLAKVLILQFFWTLAVLSSGNSWSFLLWPLAMLLIFINYKVYQIKISKGHYVSLIFFFIIWGYLQDSLLISLELLSFTSFPFWLNALWVIFLGYYGDVFNKLKSFPIWVQTLIGAVGGILSYYAGIKLGNLAVSETSFYILIAVVGISWAVFFPLSLYLFYQKDIWSKWLDRTIYFSFDSSGFKRHKKNYFKQEDYSNIVGKQALVTGGTGGIGKSLCCSLAGEGVNVIFTGRDAKRGKKIETDKLIFSQLDMNDWNSFEAFAQKAPVFDRIILNAGGMPEELELNEYGVEHQAASQLFGHYYLIHLLKDNNKINKGCRITWVSSGGMYLKKISLNDLLVPKQYDKVAVYANVKRAQITLVEQMSTDPDWQDYKVFAMHPGWVGTDGIKNALPLFYQLTKNRLRNVEQGADTIVWLQGSEVELISGKFYFDRKIVSAYISEKYIPTKKEREKLMSILENYFKRIS